MWRDYKSRRGSKLTGDYNPWTGSLKLIGTGILILLLTYVFLFRDENKVSNEDFNALKARLDQLENKLNQFEGQLNRFQQKIARFDSLSIPRTAKGRHHVVRPGDTLSGIAQQYGLTVKELCRLNKISPKTVIHRGRKLLITPGSLQ